MTVGPPLVRSRTAVAMCVVLGVVTLGFGVWAFVAPHSFFDVIASFPPYNRHLIHDAGALQVGVSVGLLLVAARRPAGEVGLGGFVAFATLHVVSHVMDRDLGGHPARDITFLCVLALLGVGGLVAERHATAGSRS